MRAIYFNLDLTLTEMEKGFDGILRDTLEELGVGEFKPGLYSELFFQYFENLEEKPREKAFEDYFEELGADNNPQEAARIYRQKEFEATTAVEGLRRALEQLSEEFFLGVLTAGTEDLQRKKLEKLGIMDLLDDVLITYAEGKNKEELFQLAEDRLDASEFIYFSNSDSDVEMAEKSGWETVQARFEDIAGKPAEEVKTSV